MSFAQHYSAPDASRTRYSAYDPQQYQPPFPIPGPSRHRTQSLTIDELGSGNAAHAQSAGFFAHLSSPDAGRSIPQMHHYTYGAPQMDLDEPQLNGFASRPLHQANAASQTSARFTDQLTRSLPWIKVCAVEPSVGQAGTHVKVVINVHPSTSNPIRSFRIAFGTLDATTRVAFENRASAVEHVELLATAPLLQGHLKTGRVALLVQALDGRETTIASAEAGPFEYMPSSMPTQYPSAQPLPTPPSPSTPTNPRKRFGDPLGPDRSHRPNRLSLDYTHATSRPLGSPTTLVSPHAAHFASPSIAFPSPNPMDKGIMHSSDIPRPTDVAMGDPLRLSIDGINEATDPSGNRSSAPPARQAPAVTSPDPGQPFLLRTSQMGNAPVAARVAPAAKVDPVASKQMTSKAVLQLEGDINAMSVGWTQEEWEAKRRLVQFWRQQEGNVIKANFRPIRASEYRQHSIVISCIFQEEKNECFVTSVDAIYLLEALIATRFTVEEKNRIRRNLEGFKPITVTKTKPEFEAFFKLIMSFPNPKPRNIEKDVKVFPWKILSTALKKIISKYSAAYVPENESGSSPLTAHSPEQATSRPVSRKSSRDELMSDAPRIAPPTPMTPFAPTLAFSPLASSSGGVSPAIPSPGHSPTTSVFPVTAPYPPPFAADPRTSLLSGHHRSYSDTSGLTLKGLSAAHFGTDFAAHTPGHQRSRTALDGSVPLPFPQHTTQSQHFANSVPVSPVAPTMPVPDLPFLRSVSHGNLSNMTLLSDFQTNGHLGRRPSSAGIVEEHSISYTPLGFEEDVELTDAERNGHF